MYTSTVGYLCVCVVCFCLGFVDTFFLVTCSVDNSGVVNMRPTPYQHLVHTAGYIESISILFLISSTFFRSSATESTFFVMVLTA